MKNLIPQHHISNLHRIPDLLSHSDETPSCHFVVSRSLFGADDVYFIILHETHFLSWCYNLSFQKISWSCHSLALYIDNCGLFFFLLEFLLIAWIDQLGYIGDLAIRLLSFTAPISFDESYESTWYCLFVYNHNRWIFLSVLQCRTSIHR